ncbi:MAG: lysophospholipid acyltransferase family protein [Candidatus Methylacidiphilales bacterium]|nr:lysophospholipid acyltransferase family protein [Candidatus Methylacidiphilales bacterium]
MSYLGYKIGKVCCRAMANLVSSVHLVGREHVPADGPFLLVANHISHFDPMLIGMALKRDIDYMGTKELLEMPVVGSLLRSWNSFPVDRQKVDRAAIKGTIQRFEQGRVVGIFPERGLRYGTVSILGGAELPLGTAAMWQLTKVPVLPVAIIGSDQLYQWRSLYRRPRVFVHYGPPLHFIDKEPREAARDRIANAILELHRNILKQHNVRDNETPRCAQDRWAQK